MAISSTPLLLFSLFFWSILGQEIPYEDIDRRGVQYTLPHLGFRLAELEPYIDAATIRVHHGGHHLAYTEKLNKALSQWRAEIPNDVLGKGSILEILENLDLVPGQYKTAIRNQGGGYLNHCFYWAGMSGNPTNEERRPPAKLAGDIDAAFGSLEKFKEIFSQQAISLFGSGYVWLSRNDQDELVITTTQNQDSPVSEGLRPILVIDVWEHSYYLMHKFRRANYISDWWKLVDWKKVDMLDMWWSEMEYDSGHSKDEL